MKRFKKVIAVLLLIAVPMVALMGVAQAQRFSNTVEADQVVHSSLYSAGKKVTIKGEIYGDVFCAGQDIKVDAKVHGDVICAGMDITVAGTVDGDIRIAGQRVSIAADVAKNATLAGSEVSLDADAKVGQDLTVAGQRSNVKGAVGRDVVANGTELIFNGSVGRNVKASSGKVTLKENAVIAGNLSYSSDQKPTRDGDAIVKGKIEQSDRKKDRGYSFNFGFYAMAVLAVMILVVALAMLFPRYLRRTSDIVRRNFLKSLLIGFVAGFAVPILCIGLGIAIVGIPLAIVAFTAFLLAAMLTLPISSFYAGRLIVKQDRPVFIAAVGAAVLATAYFLPWVGIIFVFTAFWAGMGALLLDMKAHIGRDESDNGAAGEITEAELVAPLPKTKTTSKTASKSKPKKSK